MNIITKTIRFITPVAILFFLGTTYSLAAKTKLVKAKVYVYVNEKGSHIMSSKKLYSKRHTLIRTYDSFKSVEVKPPKIFRKPNITISSSTSGQPVKTPSLRNDADLSVLGNSACNLKRMLKRAANYKKDIRAFSRMYDVEEALVKAVIKNESCFNPKARSPVGAIGLMQLMPGTAKDMKVDPWDPKQNIQGGINYLSLMMASFNNDKKLALAAYNAGPGNVRKYKGIPPFRETKNYVKKVMADYRQLSKGR